MDWMRCWCVAGLLAAAAQLVLSPAVAQAQPTAESVGAGRCSSMQADTAAIGGTPERTLKILRSRSGSKAIFAASVADGDETQMNVNSDGSPRAYHLLDPEGRIYALNDMYSGSTRVFENDEEIAWCRTMKPDERTRLQARYYEIFARFVKENGNFGVSASTYDPKADTAYKVGDDFGNGLDPPAGLTLQVLSDAWSSILDVFRTFEPPACPKKPSPDKAVYNCLPCVTSKCSVCFKRDIITSDASDKLCIRKSGRYAGFLVNQTSLDRYAVNLPDPENSEDAKCDTPVNVDPEKLPGIVVPQSGLAPSGDASMAAEVGDVVVAHNPKSGKWVFGVVSDTGPVGKFGEASIAFNRTLQIGYKAGASAARPLHYRPDLLNNTFQPFRPIPMLVLPGTRSLFRKPDHPTGDKAFDYSPANVARTAKAAFLNWAGTTDIDAARKKFSECEAVLVQ
jgi:hypothetical protein